VRRLSVLLVVAVVTATVIAHSGPSHGAARAPAPPVYSPPVDAPVVDPFRPPAHRYAAGNRGVDYATTPGEPVRAAAEGVVVFAGSVGGALHVTVLHPDGLRTSYSFLASIVVRRAQSVRGGDVLATAGARLHVGVRDPAGTYLDPSAIFGTGRPVVVRLVPGTEEGLPPLAPERRALLAVVWDRVVGLAGEGDDVVRARIALLAHLSAELRPDTHLLRLISATDRWRRQLGRCTPPEVPPPPPSGRRILVLVGGLGSTSESASVASVDHAALGYAPGDVVRFSYAGGVVPSPSTSPDLAALPTTTYTSADSQQDLDLAADRLEQLLLSLAASAPGVPVDVVGHSQGGVVARVAVTDLADHGSLPAQVRTLVTLGSPHQGADLATAVAAAEVSPGGPVLLDRIRDGLGLDLDPRLPSTGQLAETSTFTTALRGRPAPGGVHMVSVAASTDLVVPVPRTQVPGAASVVVPGEGARAHDALPGSPAVTRELALAISGLAPTCAGLAQTLVDTATGDAIGLAEDLMAAAVLFGGGGVP